MRAAAGDSARARRFLLFGSALLAAIWSLWPTPLTPLYDGLPLPADRYRYLDPPPGVRNGGPPLSAAVSTQLVGGGMTAVDLPTGERPPQAEVELHHGDVEGNRPDVPAVADAEISLRAVPPPPVELPPGRQLHGNVYAVNVVAAGVSLQMRPATHAVMSLRQPKASDADPRIAVVEEGAWRLLATRQGSEPGVLTARLPALGYVAILEGTSGFVDRSRDGWQTALLVGGSIALAAVLVVGGIRLTRWRRARRA
jgi:hypothetical protein